MFSAENPFPTASTSLRTIQKSHHYNIMCETLFFWKYSSSHRSSWLMAPQTVYNEYFSAAKIPGARFTQKRPSSCLCIRYLHNVNAKTKKTVFLYAVILWRSEFGTIYDKLRKRDFLLIPFIGVSVPFFILRSCEHLLTFQLDPFPRYSLGELNLQSLPYIVQRRSSSKSLHAIKRLT